MRCRARAPDTRAAAAAQIVYCAGSTITFQAEFNRVENVGVSYVARAWLDVKYRRAVAAGSERADVSKWNFANFELEGTQDEWDMLYCGPLDPSEVRGGAVATGATM